MKTSDKTLEWMCGHGDGYRDKKPANQSNEQYMEGWHKGRKGRRDFIKPQIPQPDRQHARVSVGQPLPAVQESPDEAAKEWRYGYYDGMKDCPLKNRNSLAYDEGWHKGQEDRQHNINRTLDQEKKSMIHENVTTAIERAKVIAKDTNQNVTIWELSFPASASCFLLWDAGIFPLDYDLSGPLQPIITYHPNGRAYLSKK